MNIIISGKDLKATEAIKDYAEKKMERLVKYFGEEFDVTVTIKAEKNMQIAEMHVNAKGNTYRAVTEHRDLYAAIDKDIDILEGQIRKIKTKKERINKEDSIKQMDSAVATEKTQVIENEIIKTLYYEIKPMTAEDAVALCSDTPLC